MAGIGPDSEPAQTITLTAADGLSLSLPDVYREVPEQESPQVPLVAAIALDDDPGAFTPTITVEVEAATPALATIEQLSVATVTRQLAAGRHVVAVDVWPVEGQEDGRRLESIYVESGMTILQLHYLSLRAGRCITVSVLVLASAHQFGLEVLRLAAATLGWEGSVAPITPAPGSLPMMDASAATRGATVESLADVSGRQPFVSLSPRLGLADIVALRASRRRSRQGHDALVAAGLVDGRGDLSEAGSTARRLLVKAKAQLFAEARVPEALEPYVFEALLGGSEVAVLADPPPGAARADKTLDVIPALAVPVTLISWLGLAPAWSFDPPAPPDREITIPRAQWEARLADPDVFAPKGATADLVRLWEQPWELASVRTTQRWRNGPSSIQYMRTPEAGYVVVIPDAHGRWVRLESRPAAALLHALLVVAGIIDPREPR